LKISTLSVRTKNLVHFPEFANGSNLFILVTKLRLATHWQCKLLLAGFVDAKQELVEPLRYAAGAA